MNLGKVREVILFYQDYFSSPEFFDRTEFPPAEEVDHIKVMLPKMLDMVTEHEFDKLMRWLGFIQGWMWAHHLFALDELKNHNRQQGA